MSHHDKRTRLVNRLRELGVRLEGIEDALETEHSRDWDDQAIEREGEEVLERLGASGQSEIARIQAALGRMFRGEYGLCVKCGEEIEPARLDAVPETPLCAACAAG